MQNNEPVLLLQKVAKTFGRGPAAVHAVREVDLEVPKGAVLLIMGPSGSGKTTLITLAGASSGPPVAASASPDSALRRSQTER
ncbi:MAG: ATP-binding cassette domain-containing protein [Dehalococcoidia bacterium]|nr:ATP-binding cassette domain-containing protein [Dehalococcoidia bacterium]